MLTIVEERRNSKIKKMLAGEFPPLVFLRLIDSGTPNECWMVCAKGDPGAVKFTATE